jgi:putative copper export protein
MGLFGTALAAIAYYVMQPQLRQRPTDALNWLCRALLATIASCLGLLSIVLPT